VLLGTVVEVALDLAPGGVRGGHDARPGLLELLGLEPEVLQRLLQGGVELHVVQGQADLAGQLGQHHVVVGGELVAPGGRTATMSPSTRPEWVVGATRSKELSRPATTPASTRSARPCR